ncbi:MAG TPA: isochorismatase family protein [Chthoniobacterales bacterium]|nr:isochorismatase family protein [Chthoniobacterales bacterium]
MENPRDYTAGKLFGPEPTELDLQLRRRRVDAIVVGGVATNFSIESTARSAYELG